MPRGVKVPEAAGPVQLPWDAALPESIGLDAWDDARLDAMADAVLRVLPGAASGKLAGRERDGLAPDGLQSVVRVELVAPCKPGAALSAERSCVVPELADALLSAVLLRPDAGAEPLAQLARSEPTRLSAAEEPRGLLVQPAEVRRVALLLPEPAEEPPGPTGEQRSWEVQRWPE